MTLHAPQPQRPLRDSDTLPCDDGKPMETTQHRSQMNLLIETLQPYLAQRNIPAYVAGNNFLYYQKGKPPKFCGPDFYVVLGQVETDQRSYVVWEENNRFPDVIIELLSESTEDLDRGARFIRYRDLFQTPEYYLYDPIQRRLEGFRLNAGHYVPLVESGTLLDCQSLGLKLGIRGGWLRWIHPEGWLLPTGAELAEQEQERAEQECERAEQERQRAERAEAELAQLRSQLARLRAEP